MTRKPRTVFETMREERTKQWRELVGCLVDVVCYEDGVPGPARTVAFVALDHRRAVFSRLVTLSGDGGSVDIPIDQIYSIKLHLQQYHSRIG